MSIVSIIKPKIEALTTGLALPAPANPVFYNSDDADANLHDESLFPAVFLLGPIVSNDIIRNSGYIEEGYPLTLFFAMKSEVDWTPDQHQVVINQMRELSRKFLVSLFNSQEIKSISNVSRTEVKNLLDVQVSGIYLKVTIVPFNSNTSC